MPALLLTTKFDIPLLRTDLVPRQVLLDRLNSGLWQVEGFLRRLTLVSASAGYGKTTLIASWLRSAPQPVTWLTLEDHDNDPARFLIYLIAALQRVNPDIGRAIQDLLQSPDPPPQENVLTALINDVAGCSTPFVLVLDDYQVIHNRMIHELLGFVLEHQPRPMHLVIATREDPLLSISRLRAKGQVVELRQADLRFSTQEIAEYFHVTMKLELPAADLAVLEERTEGWVTGLQLAALSLRRHSDSQSFVRSFAESDRFILDYLFEEVMSQQAVGVQDFLVQTSILDQLCGPLCDAVVDGTGSHEMLQALEQANLFIAPLDPTRTWYRYHHLFAELLRHRLRISRESQIAHLHERASRWYELSNQPVDAIQHALVAHAWERAGGLIDGFAATMLRRGQVTTLLRWIRTLPDDRVLAHPGLCLDASWALILAGQLDEAERYQRQAAEFAGDDPEIKSSLLVAQAHVARARGEYGRAIELAQRVLTVIPESDALDRSVVALTLGVAQVAVGNLAVAGQALTEAYQMAQASRNHYVGLTALSLLGAMQFAQGQLHRAAVTCQQVLDTGGSLPPTAVALEVLGIMHYEWNDLESAATYLQRAVDLCELSGNKEIQIDGLVSLAQLRLGEGDRIAALDLLDRAQQIATNIGVAPLAHTKIAASRVALALAEHDLATARHWAEPVAKNTAASLEHPWIGLVPVELLLAESRRREALQVLDTLSVASDRAGLVYVAVGIHALQALAASTPAEALDYLKKALVLAEPEGYIRTFVDRGEPMAALLREAQARGMAPAYVGRLLAAWDAETQARTYPSRPLPIAGDGAAVPGGDHGLAEPLSEREIEVLRLVCVGLTNHEIAERLVITVGTVKTHVHHIYGKLNVRSRAEAAARARALNL